MEWMEGFVERMLVEIPVGDYRKRTAAELRDHMQTQYQVLTEAGWTVEEARAEVLHLMGEPERLQKEYRMAWRRSPLGQLDYRLKTWAWGCVVMFGVHLLVLSVTGLVNNSLLCCYLLPLVFALMVGAYYLGWKFQVSRHPAWQISVGLSLHWAAFAVIQGCLGASDGPAFWEQLKAYFSYTATYYSLTFALCILLGLVFGRLSAKENRIQTA